jgi:hypothetical protein
VELALVELKNVLAVVADVTVVDPMTVKPVEAKFPFGLPTTVTV